MRSRLWPDPAQSWDSAWLSDWRAAGYGGGIPLPDRPSTILFPAGRHTITAQLLLTSNQLLKGKGIGVTILYFPNPLSIMTPKPLLPDGRSPHSWQDGVIQAIGASEVGIEDLTIEFPPTRYPGHFHELGYNGPSFRRCTDCWIRNVEILNADSGVFLERGSERCTAQGIILRTTRQPDANGFQGHHGIELERLVSGVVHDYDLRGQRFIHDVTLSDAEGCVVSQGRHQNGVLDHHKSIRGRNVKRCLCTDLDLGSGARVPFESGGSLTDPETGASQNVYWHVRKNGQPVGLPPWATGRLVMVSFASTQVDSTKHLEQVSGLEPTNLWLAQKGEASSSLPPPPTPPGGEMEQAIPGPGSYSFSVPVSGDYLLELEVVAPSLGSNSFFVSIDGQGREVCHLSVTAIPVWQPVTSPNQSQSGMPGAIKTWTLAAGDHTLLIESREAGTSVDRFRVTSQVLTPRQTARQKLLDLGFTDAEADAVVNP